MEVLKTRKPPKSIILRFAVLVFAVYILASLVQQQATLKAKREELAAAKQQLQIQEIQIEDLQDAAGSGSSNSDYVEKAAREGLDFSKPGERVFVNIAGK